MCHPLDFGFHSLSFAEIVVQESLLISHVHVGLLLDVVRQSLPFVLFGPELAQVLDLENRWVQYFVLSCLYPYVGQSGHLRMNFRNGLQDSVQGISLHGVNSSLLFLKDCCVHLQLGLQLLLHIERIKLRWRHRVWKRSQSHVL